MEFSNTAPKFECKDLSHGMDNLRERLLDEFSHKANVSVFCVDFLPETLFSSIEICLTRQLMDKLLMNGIGVAFRGKFIHGMVRFMGMRIPKIHYTYNEQTLFVLGCLAHTLILSRNTSSALDLIERLTKVDRQVLEHLCATLFNLSQKDIARIVDAPNVTGKVSPKQHVDLITVSSNLNYIFLR